MTTTVPGVAAPATFAPGIPAAVPAGWYPDPMPGTGLLRWWDGSAWTAHTQASAAAPAAAPLTPVASGSSLADLLAESHTDTAGDDQGFGPNDTWTELGDPATAWSWLLVFSPYLWAVITGLGQALLYTVMKPTETGQIMVLGISAMVLGLVPGWIFAELDRRALTRRGYEGLPSLLWMLLIPPFAYLLRRRRAIRREGEQTRGLDIATLTVGILWGLKALASVLVFAFGWALMLSMMGSGAYGPYVTDLGPGVTVEGTDGYDESTDLGFAQSPDDLVDARVLGGIYFTSDEDPIDQLSALIQQDTPADDYADCSGMFLEPDAGFGCVVWDMEGGALGVRGYINADGTVWVSYVEMS